MTGYDARRIANPSLRKPPRQSRVVDRSYATPAGLARLANGYAICVRDFAAKLFFSFCSLGGMTAMQYGFDRPEFSQ